MELKPVVNWDLGKTLETFRSGNFHGVYRGVELQKSDDDLQRYAELVDISQPDLVIETGTRAGGSALWFKHELDLQVVTIDLMAPAGRGSTPVSLRGSEPGLEVVKGSSISLDVVNHVRPFLEGKRVMVSLDADHHSPHVQAEIATWAEFVSPGCYLVVEDACFDLFARAGLTDEARIGGGKIPEYGGALDAIERTLGMPTHVSQQFERDTSLEAISPVSHSPVGWWRRHDGV